MTVDRTERVMSEALALIVAVRDDPDYIPRILARTDLPALAVALATLVPADADVGDLLEWTTPRASRRIQIALKTVRAVETHVPKVLQPCGTHAAYSRHLYRDETPCDACRTAERAYQNARVRPRRRAA